MRDCLRGLQKRCRVPVNDIFQVTPARNSVNFWTSSLRTSRCHGRRFVRPNISSKGFYVQYFDHNSSAIGAFCPALVRHVARKLLDFGDVAEQDKFTWSANVGSIRIQTLLNSMANIDALPQPCRLSPYPGLRVEARTPHFCPSGKLRVGNGDLSLTSISHPVTPSTPWHAAALMLPWTSCRDTGGATADRCRGCCPQFCVQCTAETCPPTRIPSIDGEL